MDGEQSNDDGSRDQVGEAGVVRGLVWGIFYSLLIVGVIVLGIWLVWEYIPD